MWLCEIINSISSVASDKSNPLFGYQFWNWNLILENLFEFLKLCFDMHFAWKKLNFCEWKCNWSRNLILNLWPNRCLKTSFQNLIGSLCQMLALCAQYLRILVLSSLVFKVADSNLFICCNFSEFLYMNLCSSYKY